MLVYADAKGSCSRRRFQGVDGRLVDETPGYGRNYAEVFKADFKKGTRFAELRGRPNLEDAVRAEQLPNDVLGELKSLARSIAGINV
jgi:hypothetical protein